MTSFLYAAALSTGERKAVLREMIEMDVAARNLTSIIATSNKKMLDDSLQRLVSWQMANHPEHGKPFAKALAKWKGVGALRYGTELQEEARRLRAYTNARGKFSAKDWEHTRESFNKILTACQGCHSITRKE